MFLLGLAWTLPLAWLAGAAHGRAKGWGKFLFLVLLVIPVFIEQQALVIFATAFFVLGFLYVQEGADLASLVARLLGPKNPKDEEQKAEKPYTKRRRKGSEAPSSADEFEPAQEAPRSSQDRREEIRRQREEEIKRQRAKKKRPQA